MDIEENGNFEELKFGKVDFQNMQVWINANLQKGKFGKMQIWKNTNLEIQKFGGMHIWKKAILEKKKATLKNWNSGKMEIVEKKENWEIDQEK